MATFRHVISQSEKPSPIRYMFQSVLGSPQVRQRVHARVPTYAVNLQVGQNADNDLTKPVPIVTLTAYPAEQLFVTVTKPNRYGRIQ